MDQVADKKVLTKTILVVDDDPQSRDLLNGFLQSMACGEVVAFENGEDAVTYLLSHTADFVIMNYHLPGMNGLMALRQIKQMQPRMPAMMITASPTHEAVLQAIQEGAYDLMVKPLDLKKLEVQILKGLAA